MRRGDVYWAEFPLPIGRRPVVLLSRNAAYDVRNQIAVAQVSRTVHNIPAEVTISAEDGMPETCVVNLDTITTISKARLSSRITALSEKKMRAVDAATEFALGLH